MSDYLTTREVAELLRLKERKVYDLVASGSVPCSKATGKLLFPREAIQQWIRQHGSGGAQQALAKAPDIFLGSHDPLLEWALRESHSGIPTLFENSSDGLGRFASGQGAATGMHVYDLSSDSWNVEAVKAACAMQPVVLTEWAKRTRGLIVSEAVADKLTSLADLAAFRLVSRQPGAGSQKLLLALMEKQGLSSDNLTVIAVEQNEVECVLRLVDGSADVTFGLQSLAQQYRLPFVPIITERFDLLMTRQRWFEPSMQQFLSFCNSDKFTAYANALDGYDVSDRGKVHFNAS